MWRLETNCFLRVIRFCPEQRLILINLLFSAIHSFLCLYFCPGLNESLGTFRWESYRAGRGPQAGAERVRGGVRLPAEARGSLSFQRQDFLDCELKPWLMNRMCFSKSARRKPRTR